MSTTKLATELVGVFEIAEMIDVTAARVVQLAATAEFPAPRQRLKMGPIWERPEIEAWIKTHRKVVAK